MKRYLLLLWFLPLFVLAQNIPVYTGTGAETVIKVTAAQPTFIIQLKSNPTTGYAWFLKDYDSSAIKLVQHQYIRPDNALVGASGVEEWTFQLMPSAFTPSRTFRFEFMYKRPWENKTLTPIALFKIQTL